MYRVFYHDLLITKLQYIEIILVKKVCFMATILFKFPNEKWGLWGGSNDEPHSKGRCQIQWSWSRHDNAWSVISGETARRTIFWSYYLNQLRFNYAADTHIRKIPAFIELHSVNNFTSGTHFFVLYLLNKKKTSEIVGNQWLTQRHLLSMYRVKY